ncbi:MAG: hypothetical protein AAB489_03705 [Patescibacteria group bacterium]
MRDNVRIPHSAILTLTDGYPHPIRLGQEALFTVKQAARMLDMTKEEVTELVNSKKLASIVLK